MAHHQNEAPVDYDGLHLAAAFPEQCCQIGRFSAQLGNFCLRQAGGKNTLGGVKTIWAAFVHIWRVFNIVKTALSLF